MIKKETDFQIINGVATLKGLAYAEEAKMVDNYLKENKEICYVFLCTNDGRSLELHNGKLIVSSKETFVNPYYINKNTKDENEVNEVKNEIIHNNDIKSIESKLERLNYMLYQMYTTLNTYLSIKNEDNKYE